MSAPAFEKIRRWRDDPLFFVTDELKAEPDPWQVEFLLAFGDPDKRRIAMKACKGPGKTAAEAWVIWNFLSCYGEKGSHPKGAATAITMDNLNDNLWPELSKWQTRSPFLQRAFCWTKTRVFARDHPETWFFSARTWPKSADPTQQALTLAGLHADYLLFILDESGGIPMSVMAAAEGGLSSGKWCKIIQGGNPTHREGPLYAACTNERHLWHLITITGDPNDTQRSPRISKKWANEQIEKYGRDNPWVLVNVFGEFPPASINSILGPEEVETAMRRHLRIEEYEWAQKRLGIDVARFGDDRSVIFPRQGLAAFKPVVMRNERTTDIAARVALAKARWGSELEFVDDSGHWGHGVIDNLFAAGHAPMAVFFEGKATDPRYFNKRTEIWLELAEWVKRGGALPLMPEMVRELTAPTYTFINGKFQLEPKDQIKSRIGVSPDLGDGLALTFALPDMPGALQHPAFAQGSRMKAEYDPFDPART